MTQSHEFNDATVDDALSKASRKLNLPVDQIAYEVLDEGSPGFLGIGARDARISVSFDETSKTKAETSDKTFETVSEEYGAEDTDPAMILPSVKDDSIEHVHPEYSQNSAARKEVPEDLLSEVRSLTADIVNGMGFEADIEVYDSGEVITVDVSPGDPGLLIGQKGETIDALQHLINISTYKDREFTKRIFIDSEGYRQRRVEAVQGIAHRMARKATREGRVIELPPMSSSERRIVHSYLKENPSVSTDSEGTGQNRRVNISPVQ